MIYGFAWDSVNRFLLSAHLIQKRPRLYRDAEMRTTRDTSVIRVTIREIIGADRRRRERRNSTATSRDAYHRIEHPSSV